MIRTLLLGAAAAATLMSVGCAGAGYYGHDGGYNYDGPSDVWYDGYYGPYGDGYWDGGAFFYRGNDGRYVRDDAGHFRQKSFEGAQKYKSSPHRGGQQGDQRGDQHGADHPN